MKSMGICWPASQGCLQMCRAVNMPVEGLAGVGINGGKHAAVANGEMVQAEKRINRCDAVKRPLKRWPGAIAPRYYPLSDHLPPQAQPVLPGTPGTEALLVSLPGHECTCPGWVRTGWNQRGQTEQEEGWGTPWHWCQRKSGGCRRGHSQVKILKAELLWETPESGLGPLSGCRCPRGDLAAAQMVRKLEAQGAAGQPI